MIFGIGTDIVDISRIKEKTDCQSGFVDLVFSETEQAYCNSKARPEESYAARFAAKEAFLKALRTGMYLTFNLSEIEIQTDTLGAPFITLSTELKETTRSVIGTENYKIHVSLSHTNAFAIATVLIEIL